jgi:hypothetical protein
MNEKWDNAHTELISIPGIAAGVNTDLTPGAGTIYRVLYAQAQHTAVANRNLRWAIIATTAALIGPNYNVAATAPVYFYALDWVYPLVIHFGETLRITSDVVAAEVCGIVAVCQVIRGVAN